MSRRKKILENRNFEVLNNEERISAKRQVKVDPLLFSSNHHEIKLSSEYRRSTRDEEVEIHSKSKEIMQIREKNDGSAYSSANSFYLISSLDSFLQRNVEVYIHQRNLWMAFRLYYELLLSIGDKVTYNIVAFDEQFTNYCLHLANDLENLFRVMSVKERRGVIRFIMENRSRVAGKFSDTFEEFFDSIIITKLDPNEIAPEMINYADSVIRRLLERRERNEADFDIDHFGYMITWLSNFLLFDSFPFKEVIDMTLEYKAYPYVMEWVLRCYFENEEYDKAYELISEFSESNQTFLKQNTELYTRVDHYANSIRLFLERCLYYDKLDRFEDAYMLFLKNCEPYENLSDLLIMYQEYGDPDVFNRLLDATLHSKRLGDMAKRNSLKYFTERKDIGFELFKLITTFDDFYDSYEEYAQSHSDLVVRKYIDLVRRFAKECRKRAEYKKVGEHLKWLSETVKGGKTAAKKLAQELKDRYPRKSAFHDELRKAGFLE